MLKTKWLLPLLCLCMALKAVAQTDSILVEGNTQSYVAYMDSLMQPLDKNKVPHGVLYNRVFPFAMLIDSMDSDMPDTVSLGDMIQAYSEFQRADYNFVQNDTIFDYKALNDFVYGQNTLDSIPVLVFNGIVSYIDSAAFTDGRINIVDGIMHDGDNPVSPYLTHNTIFPVLGLSKELDSGKTYYFTWNPCYELGNHTVHVSSVEIVDMLTAENYVLDAGHPVLPVTLATTGTRHFKITAVFEEKPHMNNTAIQGTFVTGPQSDNTPQFSGSMTSGIPFQGCDEMYGFYGKLNYTIYYGKDGNGVYKGYLSKPIIIIDGYDVGNERKEIGIYKDYLIYGNISLADELRDLGYDIVIVDFPIELIWKIVYFKNPLTSQVTPFPIPAKIWDHGCDFIERNGYTVAYLIDHMNALMLLNDIHDQPLTVIGPSMGGQISRFALTYMETHNWPHNVGLWMSFDSPHLGANIPIGFQEMLRYLGENVGSESALRSYRDNIRSNAARQMLIHQAMSNPEGGAVIAPNNTEPCRAAWVNTLNNIGYPAVPRKVAIANGNAAAGTYVPPGTSMLKLNTYPKNSFNYIKIASAEPFTIKPSYCKLVDIWQSTKGTYSVSSNLGALYGAIDLCGGGTFRVPYQLYKEVTKNPYSSISNAGPIKQVVSYVTDTMPYTCFIPTVSALGLNSHNWQWTNGFDPLSVHCNWESPFDNIYVPSHNQPHITITPESAVWIKEEIFRGSNYCPRICVSEINGSNNLVLNQAQTYNLDVAPPAGTITIWNPGPNLSVVGTPGSQSASIISSSGTGSSYIDVTIHNPCGANAYIRKHVTMSPFKPGRPEDDNYPKEEQYTTSPGIHIYPNPAADYWNIDLPQQAQNISATLTDISGRQVWASGTTSHTFHISSHTLAPGLYTLHLNIDGKDTFHKLIK